MTKEINVVAAVFSRNGKIMIARRKKGKSLEGFWELPGGKVEEGESPKSALQREILEEMGIHCTVNEFIYTNIHDYDDFRIHLTAYYCETHEEILGSNDHDKIAWIRIEDYSEYQLAPADIPILERML